MNTPEWIAAGVGIAGAGVGIVKTVLEILKWRESHKALASSSMNVTAASISAYYPNDKKLSKLIKKFEHLNASEVADLMDMLEAIILERNGREEEARLLLDYFKAEYLE